MQGEQTEIIDSNHDATTEVSKVEAFQPETKLGQQLWKIRQKIVASGLPLLGWEEIEQEINERRGGRS